MGLSSSLKRITGAIATGGLSLLGSKNTQEKVGEVVLGGAAIAGVGAAAPGIIGGVQGAVSNIPGIGGVLSTGVGQAGQVLTAGSQVLSAGVSRLGSMLGAAASPPGGGTPMDQGRLSMPTTLAGFNGSAPLFQAGQVIPDVGPIGGGFGGVLQTAGPAGPLVGGIIGGAARGLTRIVGNLVFGATGMIRGAVTAGGQFLSTKKVFSGAKILGIGGTAAALGISATEVAQLVMQEAVRKPRRARGISAANLRTTRRTTRALIRAHSDLAQLCGTAGFSRRRRVPMRKS